MSERHRLGLVRPPPRLTDPALPSSAANEKEVVRPRSEEAFRRHYAQLFRYIRRRVPTHHEAEELTQIVFADAAQALERSRPQAPLLAWLYTVAQRRLADRARSLARHQSVVELDAERLHSVEPRQYGVDVAVALGDALARLPQAQREVVVMKLLRGMSFAEIAARAGASEAACKMRFARGLESVRVDLEREGLAP
jgi:RNA polymerase sigma-70 factor (ECF subfamily)